MNVETINHIDQVRQFLYQVTNNLQHRAVHHDASKLEEPEASIFDKYTTLLRDTTYGSQQYFQYLQEIKPALDHHYTNNSHHPEHYPNGMQDMSLLDLIEMLADWKAATLRHADGDITRSIDINQKRFGYPDFMKSILLNTIKELGW